MYLENNFGSFGGGGGYASPIKYYKLHHRKPVECSQKEYSDQFYPIYKRRVRRKAIGVYWISTVFLGLDHNYSREGSPILFETMIFSDTFEDSDLDYCERCSTWREALKMHRDAIEHVKLLISQQNKD